MQMTPLSDGGKSEVLRLLALIASRAPFQIMSVTGSGSGGRVIVSERLYVLACGEAEHG
jgi:hypothetical protein